MISFGLNNTIFVSNGKDKIRLKLSKKDMDTLTVLLIAQREINNIFSNMKLVANEMKLKFTNNELKLGAESLYYGWIYETDEENTIPFSVLKNKLNEMERERRT